MEDFDFVLDVQAYERIYSKSDVRSAIAASVQSMRESLPYKTGNLRDSLRWAYADGKVDLWLDRARYSKDDFYPLHLEQGEKSDKHLYFWETGIATFQKTFYSTIGGI
jgi:hypothetical protein